MRVNALLASLLALASACARPMATFTTDTLAGDLPLDVTFDASAAYGSLTWDFDDGDTAEGAVVTHTFLASGAHTVTLTASDDAGQSATATATIDVTLEACPEWDLTERVQHTAALTEASGLALGDWLWTHNDSGDSARLFAMSTDGTAIATLHLDGAPSRDWETLAAWGPLLVIGDTGDNGLNRTDPTLLVTGVPDALSGDTHTTDWYALPLLLDTPQNIEAMAVDPRDNALVLLTKDDQGAHILVAGDRWWEQDAVIPVDVGVLDLSALGGGAVATGLDIDPRGHRVAVQTYTGPWLFRRDAGPVEDALRSTPCEMPGLVEQNEAIVLDGATAYTLPEGDAAPLRVYTER